MRVILHVPAYRLNKDMPAREVWMDLPMAPFIGMRLYVGIGDGTSEAPGQTAQVEIVNVEVNFAWQMGREPKPVEGSEVIECYTNWGRRPGYRGR